MSSLLPACPATPGAERSWSDGSAAAILRALREAAASEARTTAHGANFRLISEHLKWASGGGASHPAFARAIRSYAAGMHAYTLLADELAAPTRAAHLEAP